MFICPRVSYLCNIFYFSFLCNPARKTWHASAALPFEGPLLLNVCRDFLTGEPSCLLQKDVSPDALEALEKGGIEQLPHASGHDEQVCLTTLRLTLPLQPGHVAEDVLTHQTQQFVLLPTGRYRLVSQEVSILPSLLPPRLFLLLFPSAWSFPLSGQSVFVRSLASVCLPVSSFPTSSHGVLLSDFAFRWMYVCWRFDK